MRQPSNVPTTAGTFAVANKRLKTAYVGKTKNLRTRASMWKTMLKRNAEEREYKMPVRGITRGASDDWSFVFSADLDDAGLRKTLEERGYEILNGHARERLGSIEVSDFKGTIQQHAKRCRVPMHTVYRRRQKGYTLRQALGLDPIEPFDDREHALNAMKVKIVGAAGGFLTYDEAEEERPEVGNLRNRLARWRAANPTATEVKLADI